MANYDKRRAWISGFTGSAGLAVITETKAALWTDGRYFIQAEMQLNKNFWTLQRVGESPMVADWLRAELAVPNMQASPQSNNASILVGRYAKFTSIDDWRALARSLAASNIQLVSPERDLVDQIWPAREREARIVEPLRIHKLPFTGNKCACVALYVQLSAYLI